MEPFGSLGRCHGRDLASAAGLTMVSFDRPA